MCETILSTSARRGAMMATLRCDHPDIEEFISAKQAPGLLRHFNLSVQVTDAFMDAVRPGAEWPSVFPHVDKSKSGEGLLRDWPGFREPVHCRVHRRLRARALWDAIMRATYDYAEPGVLFVDRINRLNNLWYRERITATNPCGKGIYDAAYDLGLKGCTTFRPNPVTGAVVTAAEESVSAPHCCAIERELD